MGIYELNKYLQKHLKDGIKQISLLKEIENYENTNGAKPILVFDVMSLCSLLATDTLEVLCGGRHEKYRETLDDLFSRLVPLVELVFFIDGVIQQSKFKTWAMRQNRKYSNCITIMDHVYDGNPLSDVAQKFRGKIHTNTMLSAIESSCIQFGHLNYAVDNECDFEIASFAYGNPLVLAIFSNDTDFMIFPGHFRYFSTKDLNLSTLETKEFNRKALHGELKLSSFQLAVFATIAGNDIVNYRDLQKFHDNFRARTSKKIPAFADYVKFHFRTEENSLEKRQFIAKEIYGKVDVNTINRINASIESYNVLKERKISENPSKLFLQHHNLFTFNVLNQNPINFSLIFVDLRRNDFPTYHNLAVPMFLRQAGILLAYSHPEACATIHTKLSHRGKYCKLILPTTPPPFEIPPLEMIYADASHEFDDIRFKLLKWTINWEKLKDFDLNEIPDNYMIDVLTLVFMKQNGILTGKEADIFLWTIKNVENRKIHEGISTPREVDPHAFRLAFLYVRLYANVARSIEVCGLKKRYAKPMNFDGVFFHNEYLRYKDRDFDTKTLLNEL